LNSSDEATLLATNENHIEPTPEEEEEFDRLLESMCTDMSYASAGSKNTKADIAIPLHIRSSSHSTACE